MFPGWGQVRVTHGGATRLAWCADCPAEVGPGRINSMAAASRPVTIRESHAQSIFAKTAMPHPRESLELS